jgi:6-pyruvoyl-tetrahydropterin synthase related domain
MSDNQSEIVSHELQRIATNVPSFRRTEVVNLDDPDIESDFDSVFPKPFLVIVAAAFVVVLPFFFLGIPSGHDFEFHVNSWMEVLSQWKQGILIPRWAALAHYGYGEARFIFYPPFSWSLGAFLGALLPWKLVPGAYIWLVLTVSGCSMFALARTWLKTHDAIFASVVYAANPYHLVIVYWRSAFAELLASALLPVLLLCALRLEGNARKSVIPLALIVAGAWFTNVPAAIMVNYSLALLVAGLAVMQRAPVIWFRGLVAMVLGAALAGFYLLPVAHEQKWIEIGQVLGPGVRPQDNFLFTSINDADHNRFNRLVSIVAVAEIIVLLVAAFWVRYRRQIGGRLSWIVVGWGFATAISMFPFTLPLYRTLPELRFVQLPWRWLLALNVVFAVLLTTAFRRWSMRWLISAAMLFVLAMVWHRVQPPWWDTAADVAEMLDNQQSGIGYEGTDEYVPSGADPYEISRDARKVTYEGPGTARLHVRTWSFEAKSLTADVSQAGKLVLRLFDYPAWRVTVNGRMVAASSRQTTGQMMIPVAAGENQVQITFMRTWDRTLGGWISGITALLVVLEIAWIRFYRQGDGRREGTTSSSFDFE